MPRPTCAARLRRWTPTTATRERFDEHIAEHRSEFERRQAFVRRSTSLSASARPAAVARWAALLEGPAEVWRALAARAGFDEARGIGREQLAALRRAEEAASSSACSATWSARGSARGGWRG